MLACKCSFAGYNFSLLAAINYYPVLEKDVAGILRDFCANVSNVLRCLSLVPMKFQVIEL